MVEDHMAHEEYIRLFGDKSPLIASIGIMSDTGDT